jgi:hypothetical protein
VGANLYPVVLIAACRDQELSVPLLLDPRPVTARPSFDGIGRTAYAPTCFTQSVVAREVRAGYLRALRVRERGFSRTLSLAYHHMRERSPLIQAVVEVAARLRYGGRRT